MTVDYGVQQVGGVWKLTAVHKTLDLGLVRSPSFPLLINGVKVTSDFVDVLPGTYAFTTASPNLTLGVQGGDHGQAPQRLRQRAGPAGRTECRRAQDRGHPGQEELQRVPEEPDHPAQELPVPLDRPSARYRQGSVRWRQKGADPFAKPTVAVIDRAARIGIPLRVSHLRALHLLRRHRHLLRQRDRPRRRLDPAGQGALVRRLADLSGLMRLSCRPSTARRMWPTG